MKPAILSLIFILISLSTFGTTMVTSGDGHHHGPGCPFMAHEQVICDMNAFDHIAAWQKVFTAILPALSLFALCAVLIFISHRYWRLFHLLSGPPRRSYPDDLTVSSLYQRLFSDGLLNPKAP